MDAFLLLWLSYCQAEVSMDMGDAAGLGALLSGESRQPRGQHLRPSQRSVPLPSLHDEADVPPTEPQAGTLAS